MLNLEYGFGALRLNRMVWCVLREPASLLIIWFGAYKTVVVVMAMISSRDTRWSKTHQKQFAGFEDDNDIVRGTVVLLSRSVIGGGWYMVNMECCGNNASRNSCFCHGSAVVVDGCKIAEVRCLQANFEFLREQRFVVQYIERPRWLSGFMDSPFDGYYAHGFKFSPSWAQCVNLRDD
jgi:hypothetical protein